MLCAERQHLPLDQRALHVVVLQDHVLLQTLDRVVVLCVAELCKEDLEKTLKS